MKLLISTILVLVSILTTTSVYAQSSEQNEKLMSCFDYKSQGEMTIKLALLNCAEFANSDYDTVEEFIEEEHPELK